ncbi:MAG: CAP domain-containing protein [Gammaproteobacteria bacterium]
MYAPSKIKCVVSASLVVFVLLAAGCGGGSDSGSSISSPDGVSPDGGSSDGLSPSASFNLGDTPEAVVQQCMSEADKKMLTLVNDFRASSWLCGEQQYPAVPPLSWHCTLEEAALGHSRDMGVHNFFNHTGSDGLGAAERVPNAGYQWRAVGENIAAGLTLRTVEAVMDAWIDSPGHCANIMQSVFTEMGAAMYEDSGSYYSLYWTQNFAAPRQ